jgi:hypothetical protein
VNEDCGKVLCDPEQKGFIPNRAGCTEHTAVSNMIKNDAVTRKKELFIISTDLQDAFGSKPHDLMALNLRKVGMQAELQKIIMSTYKDAYINIQSKEGETEDIHIGKGVKQGCSLSPTLFNLGIDTLLRYLNREFKEYGYDMNIDGRRSMKVVQAYADDLLIFSDNRKNLNVFTETVCDFMKFARINFNPEKCRVIVYNPAKELLSPFFLLDEAGILKEVPVCNVDDTIKYLGVPLGIRKLANLKFNNQRISKIRKILDRIRNSGLKITQIVHAIKTYVLPRLDYSMMNSVVSKVELKKLDTYIRKIINENVGGPPLWKRMLYTSW